MAAFQQAAKLQEEAGGFHVIQAFFFFFTEAKSSQNFPSRKLFKQKYYLQEPKIV
jgi:hypothetical protein